MERTLRGHHLLCVHGFQGMGYSPEFVNNMAKIVADMRNDEITFPVKTVIDLDNACSACPHKGDGFCNADQNSDDHVKTMDQHVLEHLGLEHGGVYDKEQLVKLVADKVEPDDLDVLCKNCSWLRYGVCKEGIRELKQKHLETNS